MADRPVTLRLDEITDIDALAIGIIEQQKREVGASWGYCACTNAVTKRQAEAAAKAGHAPICKECRIKIRCGLKSPSGPVILCDIDRVPLTGARAIRAQGRLAAGFKERFTCSDKCRLEAQRRYHAEHRKAQRERDRRRYATPEYREAQRESQRRYGSTPKGREKVRRRNDSYKGRESQRRYHATQKYREVQRRYYLSPKGRESRRERQRRYRARKKAGI